MEKSAIMCIYTKENYDAHDLFTKIVKHWT